MKKLFLTTSLIIFAFQLFGQWYYFVQDSISFETPTQSLLLEPSPDNSWQIGPPQKQYFNQAYSGLNAIVTDTLSAYPPNNHSWFDIYLSSQNYGSFYPWNLFIKFQQKLDTEPGKDGGYISISYDEGLSWLNIIRDTVYPGASPLGGDGLYSEEDTLYNGEPGFSGLSDGWESKIIYWHEIHVKDKDWENIGDTIIVRFNFISDDTDMGHDGWMIDDIVLYAEELGGGVADDQLSQVKVYPNPANDYINIEFDRKQADATIDLSDLQGRLIKQIVSGKGDFFVLTKENLKSGIYLLRLISDNKQPEYRRIVFN